jgi:hypothetical protein
MTEVSSALNKLIDVAEKALICRQRIFPEGFEELVAEVRDLQPPVGVALSHAPDVLITVLARLWQSPEGQRPLWLMAVAALLQLVRADLSQVIEARRRPLDPDTVKYAGARR